MFPSCNEVHTSQDALYIDRQEGVDLLPFCKTLLQAGHVTCPYQTCQISPYLLTQLEKWLNVAILEVIHRIDSFGVGQ